MLVINAKSLGAGRGEQFVEFLGAMANFIQHDFESNMSSCSILFTHSTEEYFDSISISAEFKQARALTDEPSKLLDHIRTQLAAHEDTLIVKPADDSPNEIKQVLLKSSPILDVDTLFADPITAKHKTLIKSSWALLHLNQFTGGIGPVTGLTQLTVLFLWSNQFTGGIGPVTKLTKLSLLYLNLNHFTGGIGPVAGLTQLSKLYMYSNQLTGGIEPVAGLTQ